MIATTTQNTRGVLYWEPNPALILLTKTIAKLPMHGTEAIRIVSGITGAADLASTVTTIQHGRMQASSWVSSIVFTRGERHTP